MKESFKNPNPYDGGDFEGHASLDSEEVKKGTKSHKQVMADALEFARKDNDKILEENVRSKIVEDYLGGKPEASFGKEERKEIFKVWRTIELGNGLKTAEDFEKALKAAGCEISSEARKILKEVEKEISQTASYEKRKVELLEATPAELGLPESGTLEQIYAAAEKKGLEKCPREAGPQSAIQYEDQPRDEYRLIGVDNRRAFSVYRYSDGKRWLVASDDGPDRVWSPDFRFVWVRRKQLELKS